MTPLKESLIAEFDKRMTRAASTGGNQDEDKEWFSSAIDRVLDAAKECFPKRPERLADGTFSVRNKHTNKYRREGIEALDALKGGEIL